MTDVEFQELLTKACRAARAHARLNHKITDAFEARYGCTYSDVDADSLIESLDYGSVTVTVAECDADMTLHGKPPTALSARKTDK